MGLVWTQGAPGDGQGTNGYSNGSTHGELYTHGYSREIVYPRVLQGIVYTFGYTNGIQWLYQLIDETNGSTHIFLIRTVVPRVSNG